MPPTKAPKAKACAVCGCTQDRACAPFGCAWVSERPPVCSACALFLLNLRDPKRFRDLLKYFSIDRFTSPDAWRRKIAAALSAPVDLTAPAADAGATVAPEDDE